MRRLVLAVVLTAALVFAGLPGVARAEVSSSSGGDLATLTATVGVGSVRVSWVPKLPDGYSAQYKLERQVWDWEAGTNQTATVCQGAMTSCTDRLVGWLGQWVTYRLAVTATSQQGGAPLDDLVVLDAPSAGVDNVKLTFSSLKLNPGASMKLRLSQLSWGAGKGRHTMTDNLSDVDLGDYGAFTTSNATVAKVSANGTITAVAGGSATITYTTWRGASAKVAVKVATSFSLGYAVNMTDMKLLNQLKGRDNRLFGVIYSSVGISAVTVKVYKGKKVEKTYTKKISGSPKTYDLFKIRASFPFKKLSKGAKTVKVFVTTAKGTVTASTSSFSVVSSYTKAKRASMIVAWVKTRLGDKYSQAKRNQTGYADCSSLTQWAYKQVGISIPATSKTQAEWVKKKKKTVSVASLKPGDLLFYDFPKERKNLRYVNHVDIYVGDNMIVTASSNYNGVILTNYGYNGTPIQVGRLV